MLCSCILRVMYCEWPNNFFMMPYYINSAVIVIFTVINIYVTIMLNKAVKLKSVERYK